MPASEPVPVALELESLAKMDRLRKMFNREPTYQPVGSGDPRSSEDAYSEDESEHGVVIEQDEFSWVEYSIFLLLGMAMLWAWCVTDKLRLMLSLADGYHLLGTCSSQLPHTFSAGSNRMSGS